VFSGRNLPTENINTKKVLLLIPEIKEQSDYYKKYHDKYLYTSIHEECGIEAPCEGTILYIDPFPLETTYR
jgi:hypothetical protein